MAHWLIGLASDQLPLDLDLGAFFVLLMTLSPFTELSTLFTSAHFPLDREGFVLGKNSVSHSVHPTRLWYWSLEYPCPDFL